MPDSGLDVRGLRLERGPRLLFDGLSFSAPARSIVQLQGANGCGKTTLMKTLAGLVTPDAGEILWQGQALATLPTFRASLTYIGHHGGLNTELTPLENLDFIAALAAAPRRLGVAAALRALNAAEFAERPVRYLSAGQRQRVTLARLALFDTRLWMLDEPFTALDHASRALVEALIDQQVEAGGTVLIATHQGFASRHPVMVVPLERAA